MARTKWNKKLYWVPVCVGLGILLASFLIRQLLIRHEQDSIQRETRATASGIAHQIAAGLNNSILPLVDMAKRWEFTGQPIKEAWEYDASLITKNSKGIKAVEWIDPSFQIQWAIPKTNRALIENDVASGTKDLFQTARDRHRLLVSSPLSLNGGIKGFIVCVPIYHRSAFEGYIVASIESQPLFDAFIQSYRGDYDIALLDGESPLYLTKNGPASKTDWTQEAPLDAEGVHWRLAATPTPKQLAQEIGAIPNLVFGVSCLLSLMVAGVLYSVQSLRFNMNELQETNLDLAYVISQRRQAEVSLKESEGRFRAFMDHNPAVAFIKDEAGTYLYANPQWEMQFTPRQSEWLGKTDFDFWPGETARLFTESDQESLYKQGVIERVESAYTPDGELRHWLLLKFAIRDFDRSRIGGMMLDITESKRAQEELQYVTEHARCILWHAEVQEIEGENLWKLVIPDEEAAHLVVPLDVPPGQTYSDAWYANRHPEDQIRTNALGNSILQSGETHYHQEFRCVNKYGEELWLSEEVSVEPYAPGHWRLVGVCTDITERLRAEAELQKTNTRLEEILGELQKTQQQVIQQERLRALGQMASGIAHDFNNALSPILGFADLLLSRPETLKDTEKAIRYLSLIHTAAQDSARVVNRLKEFYRSHEESDLFRPVDLVPVVEKAVLLSEPRWKDQSLEKGVVIKFKTDLQFPSYIEGNEADIREALMNLIFNAVDAMPEGGTLSIRSTVQEHQVTLEVADTGTGMTEEVRKSCLEPFFTTKGERGTGIGLAMVYGIVQRHKGTVDIESEIGKGTKFILKFPRPTVHFHEEEKPQEQLFRANLRVLLVEDDPLIQEVLTEYLTGEDYEVACASNGIDGLGMFEAGRYDIILTDKAMPQMSGDQMAVAIRKVSPGQPIILMTGYGDLMNAAGECPEGVDAVVGKPVSIAHLLEVIAKVVSSKETPS